MLSVHDLIVVESTEWELPMGQMTMRQWQEPLDALALARKGEKRNGPNDPK